VGSSLVRITILADPIKRGGITNDTQNSWALLPASAGELWSTMKDVVWSIDARNDTMEG